MNRACSDVSDNTKTTQQIPNTRRSQSSIATMGISTTAHDHFIRDVACIHCPMTKPSSMTRHAGLSESTIPTYATIPYITKSRGHRPPITHRRSPANYAPKAQITNTLITNTLITNTLITNIPIHQLTDPHSRCLRGFWLLCGAWCRVFGRRAGRCRCVWGG